MYVALRHIARTGVAVLIAEQFQQVHEDDSDRILVIDKGTIIPDRYREVTEPAVTQRRQLTRPPLAPLKARKAP